MKLTLLVPALPEEDSPPAVTHRYTPDQGSGQLVADSEILIGKHSGLAGSIVPPDHLSERLKRNRLRQQSSVRGGRKALYPAGVTFWILRKVGAC